jgi:5,5'-dehydrodivanillate O-demethylase oxygenase subunit
MANVTQPPVRSDWTDAAHTGPEHLAGRYLRRFWQPVARCQDLEVGRAKPLRIMSEDFTLYRGESGAAHAVAFRCAHRGTQLSTGWVEGDDLRCFYHGWKYDSAGQCVEQPAEPEPFCQRIRIRSYPTQEYLGLIFVYFGEGEAPVLPRFAELEEPGVRWATAMYCPYNFFNALDNSGDPVHTVFTHRGAPNYAAGLNTIPKIWVQETEFGYTVFTQRQGAGVRKSYFFMPNIARTIIPSGSGGATGWVDTVGWRVPIDDESFTAFSVRLRRTVGDDAVQYRERMDQVSAQARAPSHELAAQVLVGAARVEDVADSSNIVNVQDHIVQWGQGAIADRRLEHLGKSDVAVILKRRIWEREMRALAEGRPLKQWTHAETRIDTTTGLDGGEA